MVSSWLRCTPTGRTRSCSCDCPTCPCRTGCRAAGWSCRTCDARPAIGAPWPGAVHARSRPDERLAWQHRTACVGMAVGPPGRAADAAPRLAAPGGPGTDLWRPVAFALHAEAGAPVAPAELAY